MEFIHDWKNYVLYWNDGSTDHIRAIDSQNVIEFADWSCGGNCEGHLFRFEEVE